MAIKVKLSKNGVELDKAYVKPLYLAINFESGCTVNYQTFASEEVRKDNGDSFPNETLQGVEFTDEEKDAIKTIVYGAMKRTELLEGGVDC